MFHVFYHFKEVNPLSSQRSKNTSARSEAFSCLPGKHNQCGVQRLMRLLQTLILLSVGPRADSNPIWARERGMVETSEGKTISWKQSVDLKNRKMSLRAPRGNRHQALSLSINITPPSLFPSLIVQFFQTFFILCPSLSDFLLLKMKKSAVYTEKQ